MRSGYKVFISFKATDKNRNRTWDSIMGEKLHNALESKGIKTFFSAISIKEETASDYISLIDDALEEAQILVAMCSDPSYLSTGWVKHEINTFRNDIYSENKDKTISGIFLFLNEKVNPQDISHTMSQFQMYQDIDALVDVIERRIAKRVDLEMAFQGTVALSPAETPFPQEFSQFLNVGETILNKYKIDSLIGVGGMSRVYKVTDTQSKSTYALKQYCNDPFTDNNNYLRARLEKEIYMTQSITSEHVAKMISLHELGNGSLGVLMDYIEGENLRDRVAKNGPLSEQEVISIAKQLCEILICLHSCDTPIIYKDLKPSNIMINDSGVITLIDFGAARYYNKTPVLNGEDTILLGTKGYAAPEQFGGLGQSDERTDIYSLGMTIYNLLLGVRPPENNNLNNIYYDIENKSQTLACIVEKCTELEISRRYQNVKQILNHLKRPKSIKRSPRNVYKFGDYKYIDTPLGSPTEDMTIQDLRVLPIDFKAPTDFVSPIDFKAPTDFVSPIDFKAPTDFTADFKSPIDFTSHTAPTPTVATLNMEPTEWFKHKQMKALVCFSNAYLEDRTHFIHVYIMDRANTNLINNITQMHLDYEKIELGEFFTIDIDKNITVDITSKDIVFDSPKSESVDGVMYYCFKSLSVEKKLKKTKLKINITSNSETVSEFEIKLAALNKKKK